MCDRDREALNEIRRSIVEVGFQCGQSAHFGGGLSIVDLLYVLYRDYLNVSPERTLDEDRDIFVLSKGHGVLGLFGVLKYFGFISQQIFDSFQTDDSPLIAHPIRNLELGIESSNGSLGQGLSFVAGMALASKLKGEDRSFVTLMGDGECNEGSVWEAIMFCNQHKLDNVLAIVDNNGFQNDDAVSIVSEQTMVRDRWAAFGWHVFEVDGHNLSDIRNALSAAKKFSRGPVVVIANTVKGAGISFMEDNNDWHHNRLTAKTYQQALEELSNGN
jgi:transketolase